LYAIPTVMPTSIYVRGCDLKHFSFANEEAFEEQQDATVVSIEDENDEEMGDNEDTNSIAKFQSKYFSFQLVCLPSIMKITLLTLKIAR